MSSTLQGSPKGLHGSSPGLTWQHPGRQSRYLEKDLPPISARTSPGISGGAAPGPTAQHSQAVTQDKTNQLQIFEVCEARRGGATADHERGGDETRAGNN